MSDVKPFTSTINFDRERGVLVLKNVRLSYPKLFRAVAGKSNDGKPQEPKFGAAFIANLSAEDKEKIFKFVRDWSIREFKVKFSSEKYFVRDGDDLGKPESIGAVVFNASERADRRPMVYDRHGKLTSSEGDVYGGCMVDAIIRPWMQNNDFGKRINASLVGVKFVGDNEPFGAPPVPVADMFGVDPNQQYNETAPAAASDDYGYEPPPEQGRATEPDPWG